MLFKSIALVILILIPVIAIVSRKHFAKPMIAHLMPTPTLVMHNSPPLIKKASLLKNQNNAAISPTFAYFIPTSTPTPISPSQQNSMNIELFLYPGSKIQSQNSVSIVLISSDDPTQITNWYKTKITQFGMNTTSFIQTNTNGNVSNKLVASNDYEQISVDIEKSSSNSSVTISVNI